MHAVQVGRRQRLRRLRCSKRVQLWKLRAVTSARCPTFLCIRIVMIRRLNHQAGIINPITRRILLAAGISPGMLVLDVGCGACRRYLLDFGDSRERRGGRRSGSGSSRSERLKREPPRIHFRTLASANSPTSLLFNPFGGAALCADVSIRPLHHPARGCSSRAARWRYRIPRARLDGCRSSPRPDSAAIAHGSGLTFATDKAWRQIRHSAHLASRRHR